MVVPHAVAADTGNCLREAALDERGGTRSESGIASDEGKSPCRSRIPKVLQSRIVVERQTENELLASLLAFVGGSNIRVVDGEMIGLSIVGYLKEAADICGPCPGKKQRDILRKL